MKKNRQINFEILRVVSMLAIVLVHFCSYTSCNVSFAEGDIISSCSFPFFTSVAAVGVNCFVLITSYFICESPIVRFDRLAKVWCPAFFYSVLIALLSFYFANAQQKDVLASFFPIGTIQYWFLNKYVALMLLAPFLSYIVNNLSKKGLLSLVVIFGLLKVTITHGIPYGNVIFLETSRSVSTFVLVVCKV